MCSLGSADKTMLEAGLEGRFLIHPGLAHKWPAEVKEKMSVENPPPKLAYPPTKEDLQRLYVEEKLSAMKIAKVYDLKYASPKTAESTILYHLKRHGIVRRDPTAHVRKVTAVMVDEWVARYQKGESLKHIAGDFVDPVTVFEHLHKRGLKLRDKVEAQIAAVQKHQKRPFAGDSREKAYLIGLAVGDLATTRHGRAVRIRLSTTHPAMARLFRGLFAGYGPIFEYPRRSLLTEYEWSLDCDLDNSFRFFLEMSQYVPRLLKDDELFLCFLGGFFDAEGSIYYHKKKERGAFEFSISNTNECLMRAINDKLVQIGFNPVMSRQAQDPERAIGRGVKNSQDHIWRITLWRYEEVRRLVKAIESRHPEKTAKIEIALTLGYRPTVADREVVLREWESLKQEIRRDCLQYIEKAKLSVEKKAASMRPNSPI